MYYFLFVTIPLICGYMLDLILGEPVRLRHPVVMIGGLISALEKRLLRPDRDPGRGGVITVITVCLVSAASGVVIPAAAGGAAYAAAAVISPSGSGRSAVSGLTAAEAAGAAACMITLSLMCWLMLAARSLSAESMKVRNALASGDTEAARYAVSMIVGRDTSVLDRDGIARAAVETVAENTSDGVTAPIFWTCLLGLPGLYFYKAVNTMDSMIGYKNEKYMDFGRCAARLDDVLNWIPSRLTALLMVGAAFFIRDMSGRDALRIWRRDRRKHASPNSAQTESACAGALGLRLAGPAVYFGVLHDKPYIGDEKRKIEEEDIRRAGILMFSASAMMLVLAAGAGFAVLLAACI